MSTLEFVNVTKIYNVRGAGTLKALDDVAYVRFASVYRDFREAKDFKSLLGELSGDGE